MALKAAVDTLVLYSAADGMWKLADFGLESEGKTWSTQNPRGTACYAAPEIFMGEQGRASMDIWALGCILYGLCTGQPRFNGDWEVRQYAEGKEPEVSYPFLEEFNEEEKRVLRAWIGDMLQPVESGRPSVREMCQQFSELLRLLRASPSLQNPQFVPKGKVFFRATDLVGTEVPMWPNSPQFEQIIPIRIPAEQQPGLIARRQHTLSARTKLLGRRNPHVVWFRVYLGWTEHYYRRLPKSHKYFAEVRDIMVRNPNEWPNRFTIDSALGWISLAENRYDSAVRYFEQSIKRLDGLLVDPPDMALKREKYVCQAGIGESYRRRREFEVAVTLLEEVCHAMAVDIGPDHPQTLDSQFMLANAYYDWGDYDIAADLYSTLYIPMQRVMGGDHPDTFLCFSTLAASKLRRGQGFAKALQVGGLNDVLPRQLMIEALEALEGFIKVLPKQMMLLRRGSTEVKDSLTWLETAFERLTANQFDGFDPATTGLLNDARRVSRETRHWLKWVPNKRMEGAGL